MIESRDTNQPKPSLDFEASIATVKTAKVLFGTKVMYTVVLSTLDPNVLALAALKADSIVKVSVEPKDEPEKANQKQERK